MKKLFLFLSALSLSSPAHATTVTIDLYRWREITEASKAICRTVMDAPGPAAQIMKREAAYLNLNTEEQFLLTNLCILYIKGRIDAR